MSSRSTTKLPNPVDRTRWVERDSERRWKLHQGSHPLLLPLRSGKIFRVDPNRLGDASEVGLHGRAPSRTSPVKYSKSISGYLQRWLSLSVCRNADEVYYISDVSLPADSAGGDTFPSWRNGKRESQVQRGCCERMEGFFRAWRIFISVSRARRNNY